MLPVSDLGFKAPSIFAFKSGADKNASSEKFKFKKWTWKEIKASLKMLPNNLKDIPEGNFSVTAGLGDSPD